MEGIVTLFFPFIRKGHSDNRTTLFILLLGDMRHICVSKHSLTDSTIIQTKRTRATKLRLLSLLPYLVTVVRDIHSTAELTKRVAGPGNNSVKLTYR